MKEVAKGKQLMLFQVNPIFPIRKGGLTRKLKPTTVKKIENIGSSSISLKTITKLVKSSI